MINEGHYKKHVGLSRRRLSLYELYSKIIDEALDFKSIKDKYVLTPNSEGWGFTARINDEDIIVYVYYELVRLDRFGISPKIKSIIDKDGIALNFGFEIGLYRDSNQYTKTTYRDYIRILATVGDALNIVIERTKPAIINFFSDSKHGGNSVDIQKDDIYFNAIERNKPEGYEIATTMDLIINKPGILLYKKTK